jgi:hypothetical protein
MHYDRNSSCISRALVAAILPLSALRAEDLAGVLAKLDTAAKNFHTTTASFEFDTIQTDPIPDTDTMTGTAYYERSGSTFEMAAHISRRTRRPPAQRPTFFPTASSRVRYRQGKRRQDLHAGQQIRELSHAGFGASGNDLEEKWTIKYLGTETIDGIKTDKLELVAKDPTVRKNISKVTIWLDTARAVSLKQVFDEKRRTPMSCHYTSIKVNQGPLPSGAFSFDK